MRTRRDPGTPVAWPHDDTGGAPPLPLDIRSVYQAHLDYVWHSLRRLGVPDRDIADVAHDVFLSVARALPTYDARRPIKPWLFGVLFRVASDHLRLHRHAREELGHEAEPLDIAPTPEEALLDEEARALLGRCLQELDLPHRAVVIMHDLAGHDAHEVASALDLPLKTVYSRLRTARLRLAATAARLVALRGVP
jgi:RNA polymerase sigma-70 factor (ECF subfamily)